MVSAFLGMVQAFTSIVFKISRIWVFIFCRNWYIGTKCNYLYTDRTKVSTQNVCV